jgi:hypothetical protein
VELYTAMLEGSRINSNFPATVLILVAFTNHISAACPGWPPSSAII